MITYLVHALIIAALSMYVARFEYRQWRKRRELDAVIQRAAKRLTTTRAIRCAPPGAMPTQELRTMPSGGIR